MVKSTKSVSAKKPQDRENDKNSKAKTNISLLFLDAVKKTDKDNFSVENITNYIKETHGIDVKKCGFREFPLTRAAAKEAQKSKPLKELDSTVSKEKRNAIVSEEKELNNSKKPKLDIAVSVSAENIEVHTESTESTENAESSKMETKKVSKEKRTVDDNSAVKTVKKAKTEKVSSESVGPTKKATKTAAKEKPLTSGKKEKKAKTDSANKTTKTRAKKATKDAANKKTIQKTKQVRAKNSSDKTTKTRAKKTTKNDDDKKTVRKTKQVRAKKEKE